MRQTIVISDGGGNDRINEEEWVGYFVKVVQVETSHARALFRVADTRRSGFVEFREFLSLMATLYKGSPPEKLKLIFDAYDEERVGSIDERGMTKMLNSTLAIEDKAPHWA